MPVILGLHSMSHSILIPVCGIKLSITTVCTHSHMHVPLLKESHLVNKNVAQKGHPEALRPFLPEISEFMKYNHFNILYPLLRYASPLVSGYYLIFPRRLLAVGLELPEDTFVKQHGFDVKGETWGE